MEARDQPGHRRQRVASRDGRADRDVRPRHRDLRDAHRVHEVAVVEQPADRAVPLRRTGRVAGVDQHVVVVGVAVHDGRGAAAAAPAPPSRSCSASTASTQRAVGGARDGGAPLAQHLDGPCHVPVEVAVRAGVVVALHRAGVPAEQPAQVVEQRVARRSHLRERHAGQPVEQPDHVALDDRRVATVDAAVQPLHGEPGGAGAGRRLRAGRRAPPATRCGWRSSGRRSRVPSTSSRKFWSRSLGSGCAVAAIPYTVRAMSCARSGVSAGVCSSSDTPAPYDEPGPAVLAPLREVRPTIAWRGHRTAELPESCCPHRAFPGLGCRCGR